LVGWRSIIRLPRVLPIRTIAPVVIMFRTSLVAVPAFSRVDPAMTSGPTKGAISRSTARPRGLGRLHAIPTVAAPRARASPTAPSTYGVRPDVAMPTTRSRPVTPSAARSAAPRSGWSSAPSTARVKRVGPPAIRPTTIARGVPKVGGHSEASSTPRRPEVPAPT
jgi:hypothetical protein